MYSSYTSIALIGSIYKFMSDLMSLPKSGILRYTQLNLLKQRLFPAPEINLSYVIYKRH